MEEFEGWINVEVRRQEKIDIANERDFRRGELPGKFTAKMYKLKPRLFNKFTHL